MSRWFRVYDDLIDDPKVQRLSPELFKALINLWCLASRHGGVLPPLDDIAFSLRIKQEKADKVLSDLRSAGLIDFDETGRHPHNWEGRQFKSDGSTERVKRFRRRERNGDETLHHPFQKQDQIQNTDTEAERKKETRARCALAASGWPPDFREVFWEAFPNKIGKKDALRRLERVEKSGKIPFAELMEALHRYANKTDDRPFCNPATWINQERWTDVPAAKPNGKPTVIEACDNLIDRLRSLDDCCGEGEDAPRLLPPQRCY